MRLGWLALFVVCGCTRPSGNRVCTPGEQRECACLGGAKGVQICDADGSSLGVCLGCPGGPGLDLSTFDPTQDLSVVDPTHDLSGIDLARVELSRVDDLSSAGDDLAGTDTAMALGDLSQPPDLMTPGTPCAVVMLILDRSGSMDTALPNSTTTRIQAARQAMTTVVDNYGSRVPFGLTGFADQLVCTDGITVSVEPQAASGPAIKTALASATAGGGTNTGDAINVVAADPAMHDPLRQGSFAVLVTDGVGNCESTDPGFTVTAIDNAARAGQPIKTYVVGIDVDPADQSIIGAMANAGQEPCTTGFCNGHPYYPAATQAELNKALDLILNDIVASAPGGFCGGFACFPSGATCTTGTTCCGTVGCKNLLTDAQNCGQCGHSCGTGTCSGGVCSNVDLAPPPDLRSSDLGSCVCSQSCQFGCVAANCCLEDTLNGLCSATPELCSCSPGLFGCL